MNNKMKNILTIILSLIIINVYGQDYKQLIKNTPGLDKYPDASAINVYTNVNIDLNKDQSYSKHVYYIKKILNYNGKHKYSDVKINYNANYESIEIGDCFSVRGDQKIPVPKEAIHDNESNLTMYSPVYINQRQTVINLPAVEPGDFIVVDYTIKAKAHSFFSGIEQMQEMNPYLKKTLSITAPNDLKLYFDFNKEKINYTDKKIGDKTSYSWEVTDVPLIKDEKNLPSLTHIGLPIFYSTLNNWNDAANILLKEFDLSSYKTSLVKDDVNSAIEGAKTDIEKLQKIYSYIQTNYVFKYSLNEDGYKLNSLPTLLKNKYGNDNELSALFITMAKAANINIEPILFIGDTQLEAAKKIACEDFLSGLYVKYNDKLITFETQNAPFGCILQENGYIISKDNKNLEDYHFDTKGLITTNCSLVLNSDKSAQANFDEQLKGLNDFMLRIRLKDATEKKRIIYFTNTITDKSIIITEKPEFVNIQDLNKNFIIKYKAKINNFYTEQDNYLYFKLPEIKGMDIELSGKTRENAFEINNTVSIVQNYALNEVPEGYSIIKPKTDIHKTFTTDNGVKMTYDLTSSVKDNKTVITRTVNIPETIISVTDYPKFYNFISSIQLPLNNMVFLKK